LFKIMTKEEAKGYVRKGDVIFINGLFRRRLAVSLGGDKILFQGLRKTKVKPLTKYFKKRIKIYKDGILVKKINFK